MLIKIVNELLVHKIVLEVQNCHHFLKFNLNHDSNEGEDISFVLLSDGIILKIIFVLVANGERLKSSM